MRNGASSIPVPLPPRTQRLQQGGLSATAATTYSAQQHPQQQQHARRAPSPSKPLLPLIVQKSELAARSRSGDVVAAASGQGGFLGCIERGEMPAGYDLEPALTSDGPMRSVRAPLHAAVVDRRQRQPVMTEVSGFKKMHDYKLDYAEIEKLPAKMNVSELRKWEVEEATSAAAAARAQKRQQQARSTLSSSTDSLNRAASSTAAPLVASAPPSVIDRDDPRTYTELLDLYSMHEFIIRKGKTLRSTPEFASFKRNYAAAWGNIESVIGALEELLGAYGVELAYIDGKKLAALASYQLGSEAAATDLVECIANADELEPLLGNAAHQYRFGQQGHHLAAAKIQSTWRMHKQGIAYKHLLLGTRAATIIQQQWSIYRAHCTTQRTIQAMRQTRIARWKQTMAQFCTRWPRIRQGRRTVIHIPSLSYPSFHAKKVPFYMAQQLGQLTRLCDLADPRVDIVFVAPFKPEAEVMEYNYSLLEEAGVVNAKGRFTMLVPEEAKRLPDGMSLTRLVLMSSRLMKMLRALSTGKPAYIVPGVVGPEELALASELNVPLLSPEPHVAQVFGTKSGCQRLLEAADVPTPTGARQLRSRHDLLRAMTSLMLEHRDCSRWLVKLETESGSRGHAYFDVGRMKALKNAQLLQQAAALTRGGLTEPADIAAAEAASAAVFDGLLKELEEYGTKRVRLVHQGAYADWAAYLAVLDSVGACIEAVPNKPVGCVTANLFIEPSGEVQLHGVVEPMLAPAYTVMGSCCPPTFAYPQAALAEAALRVGRAAFRKRIFGYLSVDFVLFTDRDSADSAGEGPRASLPHQIVDAPVRFWAVDVDLCWTTNAVAHHFAAMLTHRERNSSPGYRANQHADAPAFGDAHRALQPPPPNQDRGHKRELDATSTSCSSSPSSRATSSSSGRDASPAPSGSAPLRYVYSGIVYNPFISSIRHTSFFSLCRSRGVSYDRERRSGVVFHLVDVLLRGCLGVLSLGPDMQRNVKKMSDFQSLLNMELPKKGEHSAESNFAYFSASIRQLTRIVSTHASTDLVASCQPLT